MADPGEQTAREPHGDIVARLLQYKRGLREESEGEPPTLEGVRVAPPAPAVQRGRPEPSIEAEPEPEPEPQAAAETEPAPRRPDDASEPSDERELRERIERLDETLARISSMPPLLRDGKDADPER